MCTGISGIEDYQGCCKLRLRKEESEQVMRDAPYMAVQGVGLTSIRWEGIGSEPQNHDIGALCSIICYYL